MRLKKKVFLSNRSHDGFSFKNEQKCFYLSKHGKGNSDEFMNCLVKSEYHKDVSSEQKRKNRLLTINEKKGIFKDLVNFYKNNNKF